MAQLSEIERARREQIMHVLAERVARNGGVISRRELSSLPVAGSEVRLVDTSRGIWNPRDLAATLSIVTSPDGPYGDEITEGGLLRYHYRAGSVEGDNAKLRRAMALGAPLILLRKEAPGVYVPVFPVYVVADDVERREFLVALDESLRFLRDPEHPSVDERRYAERIVRARLHQPAFRARVIQAYATSCAMCRLHHAELLDAAHIVRDADSWGQPVVPNGLSLCKIHHAAYDQDLIGVNPSFVVRVSDAVLRESDGPMLRHGLQEMHGRRLVLPGRPADRPDRDRLAQRYEKFLAAG